MEALGISEMGQQRLQEALTYLGFEGTDDELEHFTFLVMCMELYRKKDRKYGSAWKRLGMLNNVARLFTKVERVVAIFWDDREGPPYEERDVDDLYDAINYAVFCLRQFVKGEWTRAK
jgi:hypothetical protein